MIAQLMSVVLEAKALARRKLSAFIYGCWDSQQVDAANLTVLSFIF